MFSFICLAVFYTVACFNPHLILGNRQFGPRLTLREIGLGCVFFIRKHTHSGDLHSLLVAVFVRLHFEWLYLYVGSLVFVWISFGFGKCGFSWLNVSLESVLCVLTFSVLFSRMKWLFAGTTPALDWLTGSCCSVSCSLVCIDVAFWIVAHSLFTLFCDSYAMGLFL